MAIFRWRLRNPGPRPVQATIALSLCNAVGYDGVAPSAPSPGTPASGGNLNAWREEGTVRGLAMSARRLAPDASRRGPAPGPRGRGRGSLAIATIWPDDLLGAVERAGWFDYLQAFWDDFRQDGLCPDVSAPDPSPEGLTDVGTVGLRATLPAGGEATLPFVLAWHFPELTNYWNRPGRGLAVQPGAGGAPGNYYTTRHADAWAVAQEVAGALDEPAGAHAALSRERSSTPRCRPRCSTPSPAR